MPVNTFECPICGKRTVHDEVSYAEHAAIRNCRSYIGEHEMPKGIEDALNNMVSYSGITKIAKHVCRFNGFWKCRECGNSYARKKNGDIDRGLT